MNIYRFMRATSFFKAAKIFRNRFYLQQDADMYACRDQIISYPPRVNSFEENDWYAEIIASSRINIYAREI